MKKEQVLVTLVKTLGGLVSTVVLAILSDTILAKIRDRKKENNPDGVMISELTVLEFKELMKERA